MSNDLEQSWNKFHDSLQLFSEQPPLTGADVARLKGLSGWVIPWAVFHAFYYGNLPVAQALIDAHGPRQLVVREEGAGIVYIGDQEGGKLYDLLNLPKNMQFSQLVHLKSPEQLFALAFASGAGIMFDNADGKALVTKISGGIADVTKTVHQGNTSRISAGLPVLSASGVDHRELIAVLKAKREGLPSSWFEDLLCWATPDMVTKHADDLHPLYSAVRGILAKPGHAGEFEVPFHELRGEFLESVAVTDKQALSVLGGHEKAPLEDMFASGARPDGVLMSLRYGLQRPGRKTVVRDKHALTNFADESMRRGLIEKPGYVLCRATVSFLDQFPNSGICPADLASLNVAMETFFPFASALDDRDSLEKEVSLDAAKPPIGAVLTNSHGHDAPDVFPNLIKYLKGPLLDYLIQLEMRNAESLGLINALQQEFELKGPELNVHLEGMDLLNAYNKNLSLPKGCNVTARMPVSMAKRFDHGAMLNRLLANADGPVILEGKNTSMPVEQAFDELTQTRGAQLAGHEAMALKAIIHFNGLEAVQGLCQAPEHWELVFDIFGPAAMEPLILELPEKLQTKLAVSGFDL